MDNKEAIRKNMTSDKAINILKYPDRFGLIESIEAVLFAEKAIKEQSKRIELIDDCKGIYEMLSKENQELCEAKISSLEECEVSDG